MARIEAAKIENVRILLKETFLKFCKNVIKAVGDKKITEIKTKLLNE